VAKNGELHTFVFDGPVYSKPIPISKGKVVYKKYASPVSGTSSDNSPYEFGGWYYDIHFKSEIK
jgi:hypothetical protein